MDHECAAEKKSYTKTEIKKRYEERVRLKEGKETNRQRC
jgi:hypothetical protein